MNIKQKMQRARAAYVHWLAAADAVMVELERTAGTFECDVPAIREIQRAVAEHYGVPISALTSPIRSQVFVEPRHVAMQIARGLTTHSLEVVGRCFGNRDHGAVMHAERRIVARMQHEPRFAAVVRSLATTCEQRLSEQRQRATVKERAA